MDQYPWLDEYLRGKAGTTKDFKEEWQWWRYQVGGKLFAATLCPGEAHDPQYAGKNLLTLKCDPMLAELYRQQYPEVLPGFYMDKRTWISVNLDGNLPEDFIRELCSHSYELVFSKLTKKLQRELSDAANETC